MGDLLPINPNICQDPTRRADILFVHGLGGHPLKTWGNPTAAFFWPEQLAKDFDDEKIAVWTLAYAASPSKFLRVARFFDKHSQDSGYAMALPKRAGQVLDRMTQRGIGDKPLLFIAHSLGGLLVKQILRKSDDAVSEPQKKKIAEATRAVLFLATPHAGATLASLVNSFRHFFGATVSIEDLRAHDAHLADLYDWYRHHAAPPRVATVTYYEDRALMGIWKIVNSTSAHPGVGADPVALDNDHSSIAKPQSNDAQVCEAARLLVQNHLLADHAAIAVVSNITRPSHVPFELPQAAERFFGRADQKRQLIDRLRSGLNTAVVGGPGLGKTALAAESLKEVVGADAELLPQSRFPDGIVYLNLYLQHGSVDPAWNRLANRLRGVEFLDRKPARDRAEEACRGLRILIVIEGGEEADSSAYDRGSIPELFSVLSPENRWLLLTRNEDQSTAAETVYLRDALSPTEAAELFDSLTLSRAIPQDARHGILTLLDGHPLAIHWAAGMVTSASAQDPASLALDWQSAGLPALNDRANHAHTLRWLFERSARLLNAAARRALAAAALLAPSPFPTGAIQAALVQDATTSLKELVERSFLRRVSNDQWEFTHVLGYLFARTEAGADTELKKSLAAWLNSAMQQALKAPLDSFGMFLHHSDALLRLDSDQLLWEALAEGLQYAVSDRVTLLGRLDLTRLALTAVNNWFALFPEAKKGQPEWQREQGVLQNSIGQAQFRQQDLSAAFTSFRDALNIAEQLARSDPSNVLWQRDLAVAQNSVGNVYFAQGDPAMALTYYCASAEISDRLTQVDSSNILLWRDLCDTHDKIGEIYLTEGDLDAALMSHLTGLKIRQVLAQADPSDTASQRDVFFSHIKIGNVQRFEGDFTSSLASYRAALEIIEHSARDDPSNAECQRDLGISHEKIGDVLVAQGDFAAAIISYQASLQTREPLVQGDPTNAQYKRDLWYSLYQLARLFGTMGDRATGLEFAERSLVIAEELDPYADTIAAWRNDLFASRFLLAQLGGVSEGSGTAAAT